MIAHNVPRRNSVKVYSDYDDLPKIKLPHNQEVFISDSTIRDGSQMPGIVMKPSHKLQIYEYLHEIGIEKLETFVFNERDRKAVYEMFDRGYEKPEITGWARSSEKDIDMVLDVDGIEETGLLMSVSDSHIFDKMGLSSREAAEEKYLNAIQYAVDHGLRTRVHIEDMTRADNYNFVYPMIEKILEIDPESTVRVCDTLGYGVPFPDVDEPYGLPSIVNHLKSELGAVNIETHIHDDFGLSLANSLAGYWYGANWSSLTFLGVGERAGNAEMEKLLLFLSQRVEGFEKYNLEPIADIANFIEKELDIRIPKNKAVVGKNIFAHESGIHSSGVIKNPFTYEPFKPETVGREREILVGESSGIGVLRHKVQEVLNELMDVNTEIDKNDPRLKKIQSEIQSLYDNEQRQSCISDEEIRSYVQKYFLYEPLVKNKPSKKEYYKENDENRGY
jgi:isopropylmalate/homocitrate/citramalate synthase